MAEVLGESSILSPCGHRSACLSRAKRRNLFSVVSFDPLRSSSSFHGKKLVLSDFRGKPITEKAQDSRVQMMSLMIGKSMKWWEKGVQPNMKEIQSARELVDSLLNAGNKLVILDFFSPGCGGCRALHPKLCKFAEMNPDIQFLQINYEEHKSMCYSLNVHVLPFFRFYRGAQGRVCSFSCTVNTIKKFKDALAKHSTDRCSLGPAMGLEESELLALAANKDLNFSYTKKPVPAPSSDEVAEPALVSLKLQKLPAPRTTKESEDEALVTAWR